ncbi:hypothetical protein CGCTS75_v014715 [Colletotrichum tropicale]|nr:hypothetical protein CGCTS75_v014715 [Colletotrichum tropicale]
MELMDRTSSAPETTFSGYKATHVVVRPKSRDFDQIVANDPDVDVEIQRGSIIMHAWSHIEHGILYRPSATGETSPDVVRMLDLINGIVMTGDVALDVVGFDAQKIRTLVKVAKSLNFNTAKEVRVVVELACDMHNMDADKIKEYRELLHSLGTKDPEDTRALRQLPKENKTIDATGRESSERSRITQEAQNVEEEDEDQEFVDPSDSSRHASA